VSDTEPIQFRPRVERTPQSCAPQGLPHQAAPPIVAFNRQELNAILNIYGRKVAAGEWRDYALDFGRESAVFSIFRRASEVPLYRIEKTPKLTRRQGAFAVVGHAGLILKRGHDLARVLEVLEKRVRVVG
jgi:hypothetical protein